MSAPVRRRGLDAWGVTLPIMFAVLLPGCVGSPDSQDPSTRLVEFLETQASKDISLLFLEIHANATTPGPSVAVQRADFWPPSYRWDSDNRTLWGLDAQTIWAAPVDGFLVIRSQQMASEGWIQSRWWDVGQILGTGTSFEWMGTEWTVRYSQPRFAQLSGAGFGTSSGTHVIDTGSVHSLDVKFPNQEWWNVGRSSMELTEVQYEGTLVMSNMGMVHFKLEPDLLAELRANPSILAKIAGRELEKDRLTDGQPPQQLTA